MSENQNNSHEISKHEVVITHKENRKGLKITLIILGVIMLGIAAFGVREMQIMSHNNRVYNEDSYVVFAENLNLVKKVSGKNGAANFEVVRQLPFGTQIELYKKDFLQQDDKNYYICNYYCLLGSQNVVCDKGTYLEISDFGDLIDGHYAETLLKTYPVKEAQQLPVALRHCIGEYMSDSYNNGYHFTQDPNRIASSIVKADFNLDGADDYAVTMQYGTSYPQNGSNMMLVMCYNPDIKKYYVVFSGFNGGLASIGEFSKGARIFMDSETLVSAPNNGIMYENPHYEADRRKYAVFYDPKLKEFKQYRQVPLSQQVQFEAEEGYYGEYVEEVYEEEEVFCEPDEEYEDYNDEDYG